MGNIFDDLDTDPMSPRTNVVAFPGERIRQEAHIANGGEAMSVCPKCKGTGRFRGHTRTLPCFKCEGSGKVSRSVAAAAKGSATRAAGDADFASEHRDLIAALREIAPWHQFAASLISHFDERGRLTDRQVESARSALARVAERREQARAERNKEAAAMSGTIGVEAINALFQTAMENGLSKPIFRTERLTIKLAKRHADTLYVTDRALGDAYVGKIVAGQFIARTEAQPDTLSILCEIAANPTKAATDYGRSTGSCGCCGRELTDPDSVAAGIGPICATKWGL